MSTEPRPHLYVLPPPTPDPPRPPILPCRPVPPLPMRRGIGPRRRVIMWAGGLVLAVKFSCGHTLHGEFVKTVGSGRSARCPLCAGAGPEYFVARGRRGYEVRRRSMGAALVVERCPSMVWARLEANKLGAHVPVTWETASERARRAPKVDVHVR